MSPYPPLRTLVVIGSGPGIGCSVAAAFASKGFNHIILLSRNAERLEQSDKNQILTTIKNASPRIDTVAVDIANQDALIKALNRVDGLGGSIECVFFNAARVAPSELLDFPVEEIEKDLKTTTLALYTVAQWAIPKLESFANTSKSAKPSLLVTNSLLYKYPFPSYFSLSLVKAAQRNLIQSLDMVYRSQGIHVALVSVGGIVGTTNKRLNPPFIAQKALELFNQEREDWTLEVEIFEEG